MRRRLRVAGPNVAAARGAGSVVAGRGRSATMSPMDKKLAKDFRSFAGLAAAYERDRDYRIVQRHCPGSSVAIVAPHGGSIEAHTSDIARDIAGERAGPSEYQLGDRHKPLGSPAGRLYAEILRRIDAGEDPRSAAESVIPKPATDASGRKFTCLRCLDSGLVHVWHNVSVRALLRGEELTPTLRRTMTVACSCRAGDARCLPDGRSKPKNWRGWYESARYAPESYCRCLGADVDNPERLAELREWVQDYAGKRRQAPEHQREEAFDTWNNS